MTTLSGRSVPPGRLVDLAFGALLGYALALQTFDPAPLFDHFWTLPERIVIGCAALSISGAFIYILSAKSVETLMQIDRH